MSEERKKMFKKLQKRGTVWITCPQCKKEWNDLMSDNLCYDCHFAKMRVEELESKNKNVTKEVYD